MLTRLCLPESPITAASRIKAFIPKIKSEKQLSAEESAVRLQEIALPGNSLMKITVGVAYDGDLRGLTVAVSGPNAVKVALGQVIPVESNANNSSLTQYGINSVRAEERTYGSKFIPTNSDRELTVFRDIHVSQIDFKDGDHSTILGGNAYVMDGAGAGTTVRPSEQFTIQSDEPMLLRELTLTKGALKVRLSAQKAKTLSLGSAPSYSLVPTMFQWIRSRWPSELYASLSALVVAWLAVRKWIDSSR